MYEQNQGAHAGLIMSYFCFYIYKAIRKVLFLPFISERSYNSLPATSLKNSSV